jgi:hypothetical protein
MTKDQDDWSSLDEEDDDSSFITSSSSDEESSSSEEEEDRKMSPVKITPKRKTASTLTTRENSPERAVRAVATSSKKSERKSILDSLVNKRRRRSLEVPVTSSSSEFSSSEDDFIVSDNEDAESQTSDNTRGNSDSYESSSSEDRDGPGFYSRISEMMDRKDRSERSIRESLTMRTAFQYLVTYYAICMSQKNYEFPENSIDRKYKKQLPVMRAAVDKVERELQARRELSRSNTWKRESEWLIHLESHGYFRFIRMSNFYVARDNEERCVACNKKGWTTLLESKGPRYDSKSLWSGNLKKWMRDMGWSRSHTKGGPSETELEPSTEESYILGSTCVNNLYVYLTLHHSKCRILCWIYSWLRTRGLLHASVDEIVERIEAEKAVTVEEWFGKYEAILTCIESTFDAYSNPLGGNEGTFSEVKRISIEPKKRRSSNRF